MPGDKSRDLRTANFIFSKTWLDIGKEGKWSQGQISDILALEIRLGRNAGEREGLSGEEDHLFEGRGRGRRWKAMVLVWDMLDFRYS